MKSVINYKLVRYGISVCVAVRVESVKFVSDNWQGYLSGLKTAMLTHQSYTMLLLLCMPPVH